MSTKHFWSRFTHTAELPVRLIIIGSMLISALMLPLGTVSAVASNRVMCENDASLVGCWRMEEGSGSILQDGGATPFNDGTLTNSPTWVTGKYGQGLGFNGSTQYVIIPDENSLDITSAITLAAWVKPGKLGTQNIIKKATGTAPPGGYELSLSSGGIVFIRLNGGTTSTTRLDSSITYPTDGNTWMHIAATTNGTAIKVYINGALNTSKTVTPFTINTNVTNVGIGAEPIATPINYFLGTIDDARIYNRALSDGEIAALASTTPPGDITPPAAPTGLNAVPGDATVALTWDALALPHDVKGWNVYRSETSPVDTGTPLNLTLVTTESYTDTSVSNGTLYYYTVKAVDTSNNLSNPADEASARPAGSNQAPVVTDIPDQTIDEGESFTTINLDDYVSDVDNTDAEMDWSFSGNAFLSVNIVDRVATITTPDPDWNGSETITFRATDPGLLFDEDAAIFTVTAVNDAPVCVDVILTTVENTPGDTAPSCTDVDTDDTLTYSIVDQGSYGTASVVAGNLHYVPSLDFNGPDSFTYKANDSHVDSNTANVAVTVTAVNAAPDVTNPDTQSSDEGDVVSLQIEATDVDGPALVYSALSLPDGLSIDPASGLISGTISYHAAADSPYSASVTVTDGTTPVTVDFSWTVAQTAFGTCAGETGLVGCWQMEEGSGTAIIDGSSVGNDGTTTGGPGWVTGKTGTYALSLNGTSQSASVPDNNSLDLTDAFTIAGWINPGKIAAATQDLFKKADMGVTDGYEIGLATSGKVLFRINQKTNSDTYRINSTTFYPLNGSAWMHVAATYSGGTMKLYINGVQEGGDKAAPAPAVNTLPFTLGTQVTSPRLYQGAMDDVRLYDRALTLDEIRLLAGLNVAPVVTDIPDQTIAEGDSFTTIILDDYVSDANHTDAEIDWSFSGETDLIVNIVDRVATITTPDADWNGFETITFTATDPGLLFDEDAATFTVTAVNDAPVVSDISDQTIPEGSSFATIILDSYVSDVDNTDAEMTWSFSGETDLTVNIVDRVATITTPDADWNGFETITFTATDPGLLFDEDAATFTVTPMDESTALAYVQNNTSLTGSLSALTATFPTSIPPVIVAEPYTINSRMTLGQALPAGTTVSILITVNGVGPFPYITDALVPGTTFWITDLAGGPAAAFDAGYGGRIELYSISINSGGGNPLAIDTTVLIESIISKDGFVTPVVLADITLPIHLDADEAAALAWVQTNTTLTGTLAALTATFPTSIPPVIVAEPYTINSRMTLGQALPAGTTVSILITVNGVGPFPYITDALVPGTTFWITDLAGGPAAAFDAGYGGRIELYSISINSGGGNPLAIDTTVLIESIISKDGFITPVVLADITLPIHIDADNEAPVVTDIPDQTIPEGSSFATIILDSYVSDVDNTDAEMTWSFSGETDLTVNIVDRVATITTPDADWNGFETITFTATDPGLLFDEDAATFTVTAENDAPVLDPIGPKSTDELVPLTFKATATDIDLPADTLIFSLADGSGGSVPEGAGIGSSSGDFSWTPTEAQGPGTYTFDVCVSDGFLSDCETISVTVSEAATSPIAVPETYSVLENGTLLVSAPGVLANDSDADIPADTLTAILDSSTTHGFLILNPDGSFTYTPAAMWSGVDTFTYKAYDGTSYSEVVSVTITVRKKYYLSMIYK